MFVSALAELFDLGSAYADASAKRALNAASKASLCVRHLDRRFGR
jgi:hypothetical protein